MARVLLIFVSCICATALTHAVDQPLLGVYIVSEEPRSGLHYFDSPAFPNLGYIADKPDLLISQLESVSINTYRDHATIVHSDGSTEHEDIPALEIQLTAKDAKTVENLTGAHLGARLLLMLGNEPLFAPVIHMKITTQSLQVSLRAGADVEKLKCSLETLVPKPK